MPTGVPHHVRTASSALASVPSPADRLARGSRVDALDGVRAVAVTTVLVVHALPASPFPGAVGVDVFFVVSGYLITALLLAEHARRGRLDVARFLARRFLRIAPPLLFLLVALYPLGEALVGRDYVPRALLVAQFRANLAVTVGGVSVSPLDHTWSLGQEAQFYTVWPVLLVVLLAARVPRPAVALVCLAGAGYCFRVLYVLQEADLRPADDFRLDARGGGLLVGCSLALLLAWRRRALAVLGLPEAGALVLTGLYAYACLVRPVDLQAAVPLAVLSAACMVGGLLAGAGGPLTRLLAVAPVTYVGRISYSLYLWHYVFFRAFEQREDLPLALVLLLEVVLSLAAAAMSYTVIEQPVARWSARRLPRRS